MKFFWFKLVSILLLNGQNGSLGVNIGTAGTGLIPQAGWGTEAFAPPPHRWGTGAFAPPPQHIPGMLPPLPPEQQGLRVQEMVHIVMRLIQLHNRSRENPNCQEP